MTKSQVTFRRISMMIISNEPIYSAEHGPVHWYCCHGTWPVLWPQKLLTQQNASGEYDAECHLSVRACRELHSRNIRRKVRPHRICHVMDQIWDISQNLMYLLHYYSEKLHHLLIVITLIQIQSFTFTILSILCILHLPDSCDIEVPPKNAWHINN